MCPINTHGLASWLKCFYLSSGVHDNKLTATNLDYNGRFLSSTLDFAQTPSSNGHCCLLSASTWSSFENWDYSYMCYEHCGHGGHPSNSYGNVHSQA